MYEKLFKCLKLIVIFSSVFGVELGVRNETKKVSIMWKNMYLSIKNSRYWYLHFTCTTSLHDLSIFLWKKPLARPLPKLDPILRLTLLLLADNIFCGWWINYAFARFWGVVSVCFMKRLVNWVNRSRLIKGWLFNGLSLKKIRR